MGTEFRAMNEDRDFADPKKLIELEEELIALKKQYGIEEKKKWWVRVGDYYAAHAREPVPVERKKYIRLALACGWLCGAHRFYCGQKMLGVLYLLFCWTGIPFAMTIIDLMIALPKAADENGMILM